MSLIIDGVVGLTHANIEPTFSASQLNPYVKLTQMIERFILTQDIQLVL